MSDRVSPRTSPSDSVQKGVKLNLLSHHQSDDVSVPFTISHHRENESEERSGVLSAAPQGSSPPPHCSSGSFYEGEQWKVMGHKLLIRAFLGLIVGFVSALSVSVLPHSRGGNEALCDMMSPSGHQTIQ